MAHSSRKARVQLKGFGIYLKQVRIGKGLKTQRDLVLKLAERSMVITQALIAQYEMGYVADPDPEILRLISEICAVSHEEMITRLVAEKYGINFGQSKSANLYSVPSAEMLLSGSALQITISLIQK